MLLSLYFAEQTQEEEKCPQNGERKQNARTFSPIRSLWKNPREKMIIPVLQMMILWFREVHKSSDFEHCQVPCPCGAPGWSEVGCGSLAPQQTLPLQPWISTSTQCLQGRGRRSGSQWAPHGWPGSSTHAPKGTII